LKRPDQFVDFWTHTWNRLAEVLAPRKGPVLAGAVALALFVIGTVIFQKVDEGKKVEASDAFVRIQKIATADLETATPDPKDAQESKPKDDVPHFKTATDRDAAGLKELDAFLAAHGSAPLKDEALVLKGSTLLDAGRFDDAIAAFDAAIAAKLDPRLRFLAHEGKGYALEGKGDLDKAAAAFAELEGDAANFQGFYRDRATYQKARVTEKKGDKAGAVKLYKEVMEKASDTQLKDEVTDRLALLEAK
ncbi:MAG TPA: tetratricopeptide repeat protein, partial [Polyangia bacterium]|nr:tetratricopeptide repeat protein [Polyangia bacterium]